MRQMFKKSSQTKGYALVMVLLALFLGSIASASWIKSNTLNLRSTSGSNDYDVAYTAAGLGLNYAEQWLTSELSPFKPFNPDIDFPRYRQIGIHPGANKVSLNDAISKNLAFSVSKSFVEKNGGKEKFPIVTEIPFVSSQPVFIITLVKHSCIPPFEQAVFRIVARGTGVDPNTTSQITKKLLFKVKCDFALSL
jgi:Tfp pilus assembly protein PilX